MKKSSKIIIPILIIILVVTTIFGVSKFNKKVTPKKENIIENKEVQTENFEYYYETDIPFEFSPYESWVYVNKEVYLSKYQDFPYNDQITLVLLKNKNQQVFK